MHFGSHRGGNLDGKWSESSSFGLPSSGPVAWAVVALVCLVVWLLWGPLKLVGTLLDFFGSAADKVEGAAENFVEQQRKYEGGNGWHDYPIMHNGQLFDITASYDQFSAHNAYSMDVFDWTPDLDDPFAWDTPANVSARNGVPWTQEIDRNGDGHEDKWFDEGEPGGGGGGGGATVVFDPVPIPGLDHYERARDLSEAEEWSAW